MNNEEKFRQLAHELKELCDNGKETEQNLDRTTEILFEFGQLYEEETPDKISLIRSAVFYNAALARRPEHDEIKQKLKKLCSHVLEISPAKNKDVDLCQITNEVRKQVMDMREFANSSLKRLDKIPIGLESEDLHKMEKQKIETIEKVQNEIAKKFTKIMDFISKQCVDIMGNPPCRYSIVGMGSLARREITPYSDFEHVIVLEDGVQENENYQSILEYFRWLSVIFHIIIVNLQESIVRSVASPYLNDDLTPGGDWYFDAYTTCGIKFDGMQIHACKFPLGRFRTTETVTWTTELIQPISEMAKFLKAEEEKKNGFHLGDVLTKTCFVSGDEEVFLKFQSKVIETQKNERIKGKDEIIKLLQEDLIKFNPLIRIALTNASTSCDIKRLLYRTTTLFMSALGRLARIYKNSSFNIISCLLEKNIINESTAHRLCYAVSIACETRLKVYMEKKGQDDFYGGRNYEFDDRNTIEQLIDLIGEQSLADYLIIAYAWQKAIKQNDIRDLYEAKSQGYDKFHILLSFDLRQRFDYEWENYFQTNSLKPNEENFFVLYTVGKMHIRNEKFLEALDIFKTLLGFKQKQNSKQNDSEIACIMPILIADSLHEQTHSMVRLNQFEEAIKFISKAQLQLKDLRLENDVYEFNLGSELYFKAQCLDNLGQFEAAIESYEQGLLHLSLSENPFKNNLIIRSHVGLALCQIKIGNVETTINHLKTVYQLHFKATVEISLIANCCRVLFECLSSIGKSQEAKSYLEKELRLRMRHIPENRQNTDEDILFCKDKLCSFSKISQASSSSLA